MAKEEKPKPIGVAEVTRAQVRQELDRRRKKREGLGKCHKCGEQRQLVTTQKRTDSNVINDLTSAEVGPTSQTPACPNCDEELFRSEPLIAGGKSEADPEKINTNNNELSAHYKATGQIHPALATIADLVEHQKRNPGAFSWHFEDEACDKGCRSMQHRLVDPANAHLGLSILDQLANRRAVLHIDLRTKDQRDPTHKDYSPNPMWVKDYTYGRFNAGSWKMEMIKLRSTSAEHGFLDHFTGREIQNPEDNNQTIGRGLSNQKVFPFEAREAMGATEASLQAEAHERGAHKGRNIEACPTCNPSGNQSPVSAALQTAYHDAGLHKTAVNGCPLCSQE